MPTLEPARILPEPLHCDLCYSKLGSPDSEYAFVEGLCVCAPCLHRWGEEPVQLNKTIRLVGRGYYSAGRPDPGPNP